MKNAIVLAIIVGMGFPTLQAQDACTVGIRALESRDTTAALSAFRKAVEQRTRIAESEYYLAAIAAARGNADEASVHLERSLRDDAKHVRALKLRGDLLLMQNRVGDAIAYYRKGARLAPGNTELGIALGKTLLAVDSLDAAVVQFSVVRLRAPKNPAVHEGLGDAFARQGVKVMALSSYREAVKFAPKNIPLHMKLARFQLEGRMYNDAVKTLRVVHRADSSYAEAYLEEAEIYTRAKMYRQAIAPLREYRRLQPGSARIDSLYVHALLDAGKHAKAVEVLEEIIRADSSSAATWRTYGHSLSDVKDYKAAIKAFAALQRRDSLTAADEYALGKAHLETGDEPAALASYERAVARDPMNCDPYYDLGYLYMKGRKYELAAEMFERKIRCDSASLGAYLNAGACHLALADNSSDRPGELARARNLFVRAESLSPENLTIRFRIAQYFILVDSLEQAKTKYEEVISIAAKRPGRHIKEAGEAHAQIGLYYASREQPERAIVSFARARRCKFENAAMQTSWGVAILQMSVAVTVEDKAREKVAEAVARFRRAVQLDPRSASAHFWFGEGLLRLRVPGDNESVHRLTEEACQEFRKALAIDPRHEGALKEVRLRGCK